MFINIGNKRIRENENVEFLGITIDKDLKFDKHVNKYVQRQTENLMFSLGCKVSYL